MDYLRHSDNFSGDMREKLLSARADIEYKFKQHSTICYVCRSMMRELGMRPFDKVDDITIYLDNSLSYGQFLFW